jgi:hypothetical protein
MNILTYFSNCHMNCKPFNRRYDCNNLCLCVCVCVHCKHAGYFQSQERHIAVHAKHRLRPQSIQGPFQIFNRSDKRQAG